MAGCATSHETGQIEPEELESGPVPQAVTPQPEPQSPLPQRPIIPPLVAKEVAQTEKTIVPPKPEVPVPDAVDRSISIVGTIQYVELESGFFGIVTEEGAKYFPEYLPFEFKVDGLPVRVDAIPEEQSISIQVWGVPIRILSIRPG